MPNTRRNFIQKIGMTTAGLSLVPFLSSGETKEISGKKRKNLLSKKELQRYIEAIKKTIYGDYKGMFHAPRGLLTHSFITPGSVYSDQLWDWDSWLSNIALRQILMDVGTESARAEALPNERGCILNFLQYGGQDGWMPIMVRYDRDPVKDRPEDVYNSNMHKPVIAQHAAALIKADHEDADWLRNDFGKLEAFINNYALYHRNGPTGLYYWQNDFAIGVDNDPATFFRPPKSSGSLYLNCLMYKELEAMAYLASCLKMENKIQKYRGMANNLLLDIREHCWDERDGFYYSVDLNLLPITNKPGKYFGSELVLHKNHPRTYDCLIQRLGVWTGFLPMWCGIATNEQAERMVKEHFYNEKTFSANYGIRSLSRMEKMYEIYAAGNPSDWLGPIWIIVNYFVFRALLRYGYGEEAREIVHKTIHLLGKDALQERAFHEYYHPDTGEPIINKGFQNWNYLITNMIAWLEDRPVFEEF